MSTSLQKDYYYVIDEAGDLEPESTSKIFIVGCAITDTLSKLELQIQKFYSELENNLYYWRHKEQFTKEGLHACSNHPDIYSLFVRLLNDLNFRSYFVTVDKSSDYYNNIFGKGLEKKDKSKYYDYYIKLLLRDRLLKRKNDINHLIFEQNLPNPSKQRKEKRSKELESIINEINKELIKNKDIQSDIKFIVKVVEKKECNLIGVIDYALHILSKIYEGKNGSRENYMIENYKLIEPKIAIINDIAKKKYIKTRYKLLDINEVFIK